MAAEAREPARPARLAGLEALRWVAALCVLLFHLPIIFGGLPQVFAKGYLGVDLFFILSGYVTARSLEGAPLRTQPVGRFIRDRYSRMWPTMAVGGIVGLPLLIQRVADPLRLAEIALANFLLVPVSFQRECYPLDVPAWTIIFILLGNLLHRLLLHRLRGWTLVWVIAAGLAAMAAVGVAAGSFNVGSRPENIAMALPRLALGYGIGIALRQLWHDEPPLAVPRWLGLAAMPVLLAAAWWFGVTSWLFDMAFVVIACPLMMAGAMRLRAGSAFGAGIAGFAGASSFPLYAIHFPLLIRLRNRGVAPWQAVLLALALSVLVAWLEIALRKRLKQAGGWRAMIGRFGRPA